MTHYFITRDGRVCTPGQLAIPGVTPKNPEVHEGMPRLRCGTVDQDGNPIKPDSWHLYGAEGPIVESIRRLEYGHVGHQPRPFMNPAIESVRGRLVDAIVRKVNDAIINGR